MLTLYTGRGDRDCDGLARRDFLRVGTLGLGGLTLPSLLAARARARETGLDFVRDRAVVLLYLSGGASHIETFNPNMSAPAPYRSITGEVASSLSGVSFGGTFPMLARLAHRMALVRSFHHRIGGHEQAHVHVLSGGTDPVGRGEQGFSMGSLCARLRGANNPETGIPTYSLLTETEVDGQYRTEQGRIVKGSWPGKLGGAFAPFRHGGFWTDPRDARAGKRSRRGRRAASGTSSVADDMQLAIPPERLDDRRALLASLDRMKRNLEVSGVEAAQKFQQQAFDLLLGTASRALDLSTERPETIERYDTRGTRIGHKRFRPSTLGLQMLLARRLCELGCGFVTVHSAGWDMHADGNNPGMVEGMKMLGSTLDRAVSAFLEDLQARGLGEKILLVITGDFGRTPRINKRGGRDHWANLGTLAFAGGGLNMGQVIGRSDRRNGEPDSEPISPGNMMASILNCLFDLGRLRVARGIPRELLSLVENEPPIRELF